MRLSSPAAPEGSEGGKVGQIPPVWTGSWLRFESPSSPVVHAWPGSDTGLQEALRAVLKPAREPIPRPADQIPGDGILFLAAGHPECLRMLRQLRGEDACRLLPIALAGSDGASPDAAPLADASAPMGPGALRASLLSLEACLDRVRALPQAEDVSALEGRELDFLRFLHTRGVEELNPVLDAGSPVAFHFPIAESLLGVSAFESWETLEELREKGLFEGNLEERVFLCRGCRSSRLLLRETCPKCQVPSLITAQTIHHFPCAHVGSRESFEHDGLLVCPKCQGQLRHIGVDYDRPEAEQQCERCGEHWLEGVVQARCLECDARFAPEEALLVDLRRLRPTPLLHKAAERPWSPLSTVSRILSHSLESMDAAAFEIVRAHTERVCRRYGRPATRIRVRIEESRKAGEPSARGSYRSHLAAIARKIRELIRSTDAVTVGDRDTVEILLTETDPASARIVSERIEQVLRDVPGDPILFDVAVEPLVAGEPGAAAARPSGEPPPASPAPGEPGEPHD